MNTFLTEHCNRLKNGQCMTLACLKRGGYKRGGDPVSYEIATCEPFEILKQIEQLTKERDEARAAYQKLDDYVESCLT